METDLPIVCLAALQTVWIFDSNPFYFWGVGVVPNGNLWNFKIEGKSLRMRCVNFVASFVTCFVILLTGSAHQRFRHILSLDIATSGHKKEYTHFSVTGWICALQRCFTNESLWTAASPNLNLTTVSITFHALYHNSKMTTWRHNPEHHTRKSLFYIQ